MRSPVYIVVLLAYLTVTTSAAIAKPTKQPLETTLERPTLAMLEHPMEQPVLTSVGTPKETTVEVDCIPRICHRMYRPVCGLVDGKQFTAPSRCEFNNKVRCAARARLAGRAAPVIRFLYNGSCGDNEDTRLFKSNVFRRGKNRYV